MSIAQGLSKVVAYKKNDSGTWGTLPTVKTGAKTVRRVSSNFNLNKETYQSEEIRTDYQMSDFRHGVRSVEGSISGELSAGSYADFIGSALARDFTAGTSTTGVTLDATAAAPQFTRAAGSWITDGVKIGDIVGFTGFTATANNNKNFLVIALTATEMTVVALDGSEVVAELGSTVDAKVLGSKTFVPKSGHTSDDYVFEEFYQDINQSEVYTGNKVNSISMSLPASGMSTIEVGFMGKDRAETGTSQYFTSPDPQGCGRIFAAVNGALIVDGKPLALVTSMSFNINRNLSTEAVVGSNTNPDIFDGRCIVDGEFSYLFTGGDLRDYFDNETEVAMVVAMAASNDPDAEAISIVFPRIKINGSSKDDGEKGIVASAPFQALMGGDCAGTVTAHEATTITIQDTSLV